MPSPIKKISFFMLRLLCLCAITLACYSTAAANVRQDSEQALAGVQQNSVAVLKYPDDVKSLVLVFEIAQRYFSSNDLENADKFYLLALQKARIIESMLNDAETVSSVDRQPAVNEFDPEPESNRLVGARGVYTVVKGDSVRLVAAKLGVTQQHLRSMNGMDQKAYFKVGQKVVYNNRKIIPQPVSDGIIVNIPDRTLYYFQRGELVKSLPVAVGSPTKNEKYVWQTPVGKFRITGKVKDPTWTVPPSIQAEMGEQGKEIIASVPPGPENPLGKYAIKTSIPGILIHSTTKPSSIYSFSSHGCIRISPGQMEDFFPQIRVNTRGEIIYKPVKLAVTESGRVYLEVHQDIYNKNMNLFAEARQMIEKLRLSDQIDWEKFKSVVKNKRGMAEDITL